MKLSAPLDGKIVRTGKYGNRAPIPKPGGGYTDPNHRGVDIRAAVGTPVKATVGGVVVQTRIGYVSPSRPGTIQGRAIFSDKGSGNLVVIRGDDGNDHIYAHLSKVNVSVGQRVNADKVFCLSGMSGVTQPHLHYGIWREVSRNRWEPIDPTPAIPWTGDKFGELRIEPTIEVKPIKDDEMAKTLKYRRKSKGYVVTANVSDGHIWYVPGPAYLGYVDALEVCDDNEIRELTDDSFRMLVTITIEGRGETVKDHPLEWLIK